MTGFDIRAVFSAISAKLTADYQRTSQIAHRGGKGSAREESLRAFLRDYLPARYSIGQGEVLHWSNQRSRQCDIVIYDGSRCPRLLIDDDHSVFPLESVFGTVEVKSVLTAQELERAFENAASVKRLVPPGAIIVGGLGLVAGLPRPTPVTSVFAYSADRSPQAVLDQYASLERAAGIAQHAPEHVVILGEGIISRPGTRDPDNSFDVATLGSPPVFRRAGKHTLLRFYLEFLDALNTLSLETLDLQRYLNMPVVLGGHRVSYRGNLVRQAADGTIQQAFRITAAAIQKIVDYCRTREAVPIRTHLSQMFGGPVEMYGIDESHTFKVYNPNNRTFAEGGPLLDLQIDDVSYQVDMAALEPDTDFEIDPDPDMSDLISQSPTSTVPGQGRNR
jgi:hypothetical protein